MTSLHNYVGLDQLYVSPLNVRKTPPDPTSADFQEFLESVRASGRIQDPLWVRPHPTQKTTDGRPLYEAFDGQCRMLAARILGIKTLPVLVTLERDDAKILRQSAFSTKRFEVVAWDWAANVEQLMQMEKEGVKLYPTYKDAATFFCVSQARVSMWLKVAALPDSVKAQVLAGRLTHKAAERIAHGFPTAEAQLAAAGVALDAGGTQREQVAAVEVVRDEPDLLQAAPEERTQKVREGIAKKGEKAARKLLAQSKGPSDPASSPLPITTEERDAFERLAREHGLEADLIQMRAVPDDDPASFARLRAAMVGRIQAAGNERAPRQANPDAVAAAFGPPRLEAPDVFATQDELALAEQLVGEVCLEVHLDAPTLHHLPQTYRFGSPALPGMRQAALRLVLATWREAGLLEPLLRQRPEQAPPPLEESHASAEGSG